jgi:hypothetical protein
MSRALAALVFVGIGTSATWARADAIAKNIQQLADADAGEKVHLAAALALAKTKDARAVIAVADALARDGDAALRRVAAVGLSHMIDARTAEDARALALAALDSAAEHDPDARVRDTAARVARSLAKYRKHDASPEVAVEPRGDRPEVLVKIDGVTDATQRAPADAPERVTAVVKRNIEAGGYATTWPGGTPTSDDLARAGSQAFIVASTVKKVDVARRGSQTQIGCSLAIRVSPWGGSDSGERWEASKAAQAQGAAKAMTGTTEREIRSAVRDCLEAVAEDVTAREIVPFLKRLALKP